VQSLQHLEQEPEQETSREPDPDNQHMRLLDLLRSMSLGTRVMMWLPLIGRTEVFGLQESLESMVLPVCGAETAFGLALGSNLMLLMWWICNNLPLMMWWICNNPLMMWWICNNPMAGLMTSVVALGNRMRLWSNWT
jgi:hypothetical protein